MKKFKFLFVALAMVSTVMTGCKKDIDVRADFVTTYSVSETWSENGKTLTKPPFIMPVEKSWLNNTVLLFGNFANYGAGIAVEASVSGNSITIPQQTLPNLRIITGSGSLDGYTLNFTYTETYNGVSNKVTTVAKKK